MRFGVCNLSAAVPGAPAIIPQPGHNRSKSGAAGTHFLHPVRSLPRPQKEPPPRLVPLTLVYSLGPST